MKPHKESDNAEIYELHKTQDQANIKKAFDLIDKQEWSLKKVIDYVLKNHVFEGHYRLDMNLVDSRFFYLGPLHFYFTAKEYKEQFDLLTKYKLSLYLYFSIDDKYGASINDVVFKDIQTIALSDFEKDEEMRPFDKQIDEYIEKILSGIDTTKTKDLYSYILSYYSDFIDKIKISGKL